MPASSSVVSFCRSLPPSQREVVNVRLYFLSDSIEPTGGTQDVHTILYSNDIWGVWTFPIPYRSTSTPLLNNLSLLSAGQMYMNKGNINLFKTMVDD